MKTVNTIVKILSALAAIAGAVYIAATYGEQIAAWAKKVLASLPCNCKVEIVSEAAEEEAPAAEEVAEEVAEEAAEEEAPAEEKAEEAVVEEADFAE